MQAITDAQFKEKVLELKYKFMNQTDALLHGDLHTGSIMLNKDETFVIDPEFAFIGPFGFDIGALLANLVHNYVHHHIVTKDEKYKSWVLSVIKETLNMFDKKFIALWNKKNNSALITDGFIDNEALNLYKRKFLKSMLNDTIGFAGCKMARRVFGVAGVEDIRGIEDETLKAKAEKTILDIAKVFVIKYDKIDSIGDIIEIIKEKSGN